MKLLPLGSWVREITHGRTTDETGVTELVNTREGDAAHDPHRGAGSVGSFFPQTGVDHVVLLNHAMETSSFDGMNIYSDVTQRSYAV